MSLAIFKALDEPDNRSIEELLLEGLEGLVLCDTAKSCLSKSIDSGPLMGCSSRSGGPLTWALGGGGSGKVAFALLSIDFLRSSAFFLTTSFTTHGDSSITVNYSRRTNGNSLMNASTVKETPYLCRFQAVHTQRTNNQIMPRV